jgi:ABC-type nickel/cobalt efflux system permease component RcnA
MKSAILIALIAAILQVFASLYYLLVQFEVLKYNNKTSQLLQPLFFLSSVGLLIYFIQLYDYESRKR